MTGDGFLQQKQRHPLAMTAAITINLAAVAAVMLAKSGYVPPIGGILTVTNIPLPKQPDPTPPPKRADPQVRKDPVYIPRRQVESDSKDDPARDRTDILQPTGGELGGGGGGAGTLPGPDPTPVRPAILTDPVPLPSAVRDFQPPYPPQLLRTGVEGKVVVRILIDPEGRVTKVEVISSDSPSFADATERQALRRWRFRPATRDGVAVESWKQMTVRFEIRS